MEDRLERGARGGRRSRALLRWVLALSAIGAGPMILGVATGEPSGEGVPGPALVHVARAGGLEDGLTLERIFSDPRLDGVTPRNPEWSPTEPVLAFLWSKEGRRQRDLWIHVAPSGEGRRLTDVASQRGGPRPQDEATAERHETMRLVDEGVDAFEWAPDGKSILFTLDGDIFQVNVDGGDPRPLTRTAAPEFDPQFSPYGSRIAFVRENDLWVMNLNGGGTVQVTTDGSETLLNGLSDYISLEELGRFSAYRWSADGRYLVYVQADTSPIRQLEIPDYLTPHVSHRLQRRPPAGEANARTRVGVVASSGGPTRWLELRKNVEDFYVPKLERVADKIALLQQERSLERAWLFLVDPEKASAREILEERDEAWINLDRAWLYQIETCPALLYGSERTGWGHLYRVDTDTGELHTVTSGEWEVTDLDRVVDCRVYFTATAHGCVQRHLYRVSVSGGEPERLTSRVGWNEAKISHDGTWMAVLYSNTTTPFDLYVGRVGSSEEPERITWSPAEDFKKLRLPEPEFIRLRSRVDGAKIPAMLYRPEEKAPQKNLSRGDRHPAIVHVHGGGYAQSYAKKWGGTTYLIHTLFTRQGYYVLDVDYRGSSGHGRQARTGVHLHLGGLDLEDTLAGADYLRGLADVDPNRVGIWGWSYGGFLTNMAMLARPEVFDAGVAVAPVNDWAAYDTHYTEERLGRPQDQPEAYMKSSPITYAEGLKRPLLMIHGLQDDNVHAQDTMRLVDALVRAGKDFEMMVYPEAKHGIRRDASRIHLYRKIFDFFAEKMPPR